MRRPGLCGLLTVAGLAVPVLAAATARRRFALVMVVGPSMLPALAPGDRVLVRRAGLSELRRGQVVVVEKPADDGTWPGPPLRWPPDARDWMIKRVAAVPGETWACPGAPARARSAGPGDQPGQSTALVAGPVPRGTLVLLGDNPERSYDSRQLGYFPGERLLGVMVWVPETPSPQPSPKQPRGLMAPSAGNRG